ncbi:hypothetical protein HPP92_014934 [Vanilla planifolia]|uniref:BP28 C-terminal domain-containing protein n=1 Tax=Vanilla planifolia TaxID=51239 RepID=A0A835UT68_VANPL|nr:hypothetical protein HPP92_014934 [Vanilla planifolia]
MDLEVLGLKRKFRQKVLEFDMSTKDAILSFILSASLKSPSFGKFKVLSLFKTMGNTILKMECCKDLLVELLKKRKEYLFNIEKLHEGLLESEIETLCLLLEFCVPHSYPGNLDAVGIDCLLKALNVDGLVLEEPVVEKPCVTVLKNLNCSFYDNLNSSIQDKIFTSLVYLFQCDSGVIRNAAREALLKLDISSSTIHSFLEGILSQDLHNAFSKRIKKNKSMTIPRCYSMDACGSERIIVHVLGSLLDIILLKKNFSDRVSLVQPLFKVLGKLCSRDHLLSFLNSGRAGEFVSEISESLSAVIQHAQQSSLLVLKNIIDSLNMGESEKDELCSKLDISLLVECACSAMDFATRNSIFILLSSIAKISSGWLSEHIIDLFAIVGESAAMQGDSHSQHILENLISTLVPCWLSKTNNVGKLFKIFMKDLPEMAEHRRLSLVVYLLRTLGEMDNLGILYYNLFHSLTFRLLNSSSGFEANLLELISPSSMIFEEWEYTFALKLCDQYSGKAWFPCLVKLLQEIEHSSMQHELLLDLYLTMQFMREKLMDTCLVFELESGNDADFLQSVLGELMEQLILHLQIVGVRCKQLGISRNILREIKNSIARVIETLTEWMKPDTFFKSIVQLLGKGDGDAMKKTLGFLCESVKEQGSVKGREMEITKRQRKAFFPVKVTGHVVPSFNELCSKINQLISSPSTDTPLKLSAISTIEVLAKEFHCDEPIFGSCLQTVVGEIDSSDLALSSACIRSTAALVGVLGSHALKQLPCIMEKVFGKVHELFRFPSKKSKQRTDGFESYKASLLLSILSALEAIITNLSGFLNPYLDTIIVIIVHPDCVLHPEAKINTRAATVRKLITEKIPVRLILPPLLNVDEAVLRCHTSLSFVFEMLGNLVSGMDRTSIGSYYVKIYDKCLASLDIRHQVPDSVKDVNLVEQSVIQAMVVLTMKLTEAMFRPLFLHSLEWAESELEENQSSKSISVDRSISFYNFVNKLIQKHRSLFVPYFKYLLESCIRYLSEDQTLDLNSLHQKRKKAKIGDPQTHLKAEVILPTKLWHVRALVLKALYQCFLYDTTETKLLDASNFQVLLKPIISQLVVEPPSTLNDYPHLPSVEDVDESLVLCLGQMAVTARSDVLWKPLNHEVLMQTRNDKIRPKILGLRVVRYLLEHLREEYLVFLPETIPFLGELLEDVELQVKTLAQEILKEMEVLSGESLKQYL